MSQKVPVLGRPEVVLALGMPELLALVLWPSQTTGSRLSEVHGPWKKKDPTPLL